MNGAMIVQADSVEQGELLQSVLLAGHFEGSVTIRLVPEHAAQQILGRESIGQAAKKKAHNALQTVHDTKCSLGFARGIEMLPSGTFVVCCAAIRYTNGRESIGWSQPRLLPETVAAVVGNGGDFFQAMATYKQRWHITDTLSLSEIDEILSCRQGTEEAVQAALVLTEN